MRPSLSLLPLAVLLAQGIHARAKDIDVCTQVTRQYITNGDFATDSDWTASEDYTIVTKSGSDSGYMLVEQPSRFSDYSLTEGKKERSRSQPIPLSQAPSHSSNPCPISTLGPTTRWTFTGM